MDNEDNVTYIKEYIDYDAHHGVDGWLLVDMEWYPEDGMSCFQYERTIPGVGIELAVKWREQPATFQHEGWWERDRTERILKLTERDWSRYERGLYSEPVEVEYD